MVITEGLVGPKPIPNGGGDGEQVNIPAHCFVSMEGRSVVLSTAYWIAVGAMRVFGRQIRQATARVESEVLPTGRAKEGARFQEKLLRLNKMVPYRKPTQVVGSRRPRRTSERSLRNSAKKRP